MPDEPKKESVKPAPQDKPTADAAAEKEDPLQKESREANEKHQKLIDDISLQLTSALDGVYGTERSRILEEISKRSSQPKVVARASQLRAPRETIREAEAAAPFIVTGPARNVQDQKDEIAKQQDEKPATSK